MPVDDDTTNQAGNPGEPQAPGKADPPEPGPSAPAGAPGAVASAPGATGADADDGAVTIQVQDPEEDGGDVVLIDGDAPGSVLSDMEHLIREALHEETGKEKKKEKAARQKEDIKALLREKAQLNRQVESFSAELYNLRTEMKRMEEEKAELVDQVKRAHAELINFRKRVDRDKEDTVKYAVLEVMEQVVPVLDNFDRALASAPADVPQGYAQGVALIHQSLTSILKKLGLTVVEAKGRPFDPNVHEAIMRETTDKFPNDYVTEELQKGYKFHDRLIRPAMVKVAFNEKEEGGDLARDFFGAGEGAAAPESAGDAPPPAAPQEGGEGRDEGARGEDPLEDTLVDTPDRQSRS